MARMSIDDKVCRDPRITMLASLLGWSRRETVGCLILEVWPICYDQETAIISERVIDAAAAHAGFAQALIEAELASRDRSGRVRISGAKERIEYLNRKRRAGHEGGLKSAESRTNRSKQTSSSGGSTPQAVGNPSVPDLPSASAPDLPPALVLVSDQSAAPDPGPTAPKRQPNRTKRQQSEAPFPSDWVPTDDHRLLAVNLGLNCDVEADAFRDRNLAKGERYADWDAAFRTWLRNARKFADRDRAARQPAQSGFDAVMRIARGEEP